MLKQVQGYLQNSKKDKQLEEPLLMQKEGDYEQSLDHQQQMQSPFQQQQQQNDPNASMQVPDDLSGQRLIYLDGEVHPPDEGHPNIVCNQKYTVKNFVPQVLFNQFKYFFNLFFLILAISQFIPAFKVGFLFTYVAPLAFVLLVTMGKEAYDDYQRFKRDQEANSQEYTVIRQDGEVKVPSSNIKCGDLVIVCVNQRVPADLALLHTNDPEGTVFIRTDQLDGETDWKLRKAVKYTQNYYQKNALHTLKACIIAEAPKKDIYDFIGLFKLEVGGGEGYRESLNLENTMWANTYVAAGKVIGMALYTGSQTRSQLNSKEPRTKQGTIDTELNKLSQVCFGFMCILALLMVLLEGESQHYSIDFFRFILLFSSIIPISLRLNLDFAKLSFAYKINHDTVIDGTIARNSTIPEELGRIQFILTDKTGTLTKNEMIFKRLSLETVQFDNTNGKDLQKIMKKQCAKFEGPMSDVEQRVKNDLQPSPFDLSAGGAMKRRKTYKRDQDMMVRDIITALCLCHNVTPVYEGGTKIYQASSPDEIALVKIAEQLDLKLVSRTQDCIEIENAKGIAEQYKILANFPFSSETKRMGILLRHVATNRIIFYLKGADNIMKNKVPDVKRGFLSDECENLAMEGLRTLVIAQRYLTETDYQLWNKQYQDANSMLKHRDVAVKKVVESLEADMEFLGITGVEDKLQDNVQATIENLRNAGINVWMLTGDKVETAICIAISTGLKAPDQNIFVIRDIDDPLKINTKLNEYSSRNSDVLIIDGVSLNTAMTHKESLFFQLATVSPAVVCCRCSPTQKADVTECIKRYTGKITLGVGDGGNDVGMIQAAHVGVGIVGKEGMQAALASDFSILQFKYLAKLILFHGRMAYKRTAVMSQFVIHRGTIMSMLQCFFCMLFNYMQIQMFNGWLMLGYATIFTMLPVFCLIFDEDISYEISINYPELYKTLQKGRDLTAKTFLKWVWKSIYQGIIIITISLAIYDKTFWDLISIAYTSLILTLLLNIYSQLNRINLIILTSKILTFGIYIILMYLAKDYLNSVDITNRFILKVLFVTFFAWVPLEVAKVIVRRKNPSDYQKIMKAENRRRQFELMQQQQEMKVLNMEQSQQIPSTGKSPMVNNNSIQNDPVVDQNAKKVKKVIKGVTKKKKVVQIIQTAVQQNQQPSQPINLNQMNQGVQQQLIQNQEESINSQAVKEIEKQQIQAENIIQNQTDQFSINNQNNENVQNQQIQQEIAEINKEIIQEKKLSIQKLPNIDKQSNQDNEQSNIRKSQQQQQRNSQRKSEKQNIIIKTQLEENTKIAEELIGLNDLNQKNSNNLENNQSSDTNQIENNINQSQRKSLSEEQSQNILATQDLQPNNFNQQDNSQQNQIEDQNSNQQQNNNNVDDIK